MKKIGMLAMLLGIAGVIGAAAVSSPDALAKAGDCHRSTFQTKLVKEACAKGGQKEAKAAMKAFLKDAKKKKAGIDCESCHTKLAPEYPLKQDGLKQFADLGGEVIDTAALTNAPPTPPKSGGTAPTAPATPPKGGATTPATPPKGK